jgi:hypothetical protein
MEFWIDKLKAESLKQKAVPLYFSVYFRDFPAFAEAATDGQA